MGRQSRPLTGEAMPQGRPTGAAFRAREFRRSASLTWDCEGFETDNLARQPAGMRRAATLPHGSTTTEKTTMPKLKKQSPPRGAGPMPSAVQALMAQGMAQGTAQAQRRV